MQITRRWLKQRLHAKTALILSLYARRTALHYAICRAFLNAGIHVVCDKPLTIEKQQAVALKQLADAKNLILAVTYSYTGHVTLRAAKEMIAAGAIGNIRMIMAEYPLGWLSKAGAGGKQAWRLDPTQSGKSACMADIGTISKMRYIP